MLQKEVELKKVLNWRCMVEETSKQVEACRRISVEQGDLDLSQPNL
jgi:hypothetical protein